MSINQGVVTKDMMISVMTSYHSLLFPPNLIPVEATSAVHSDDCGDAVIRVALHQGMNYSWFWPKY